MKDRRIKTIILQWVIPFIILLLVVGVLLLQFFVTSQKEELSEVHTVLTDITEDYAYNFNVKLRNFSIASDTLGSIVEKADFKSLEIAWNVTNALVENTEAYMAVVCDKSGKGYNQNGESVNLTNQDYFVQLVDSKSQYVYCKDDGIEGRVSIITVTPLSVGDEEGGYLLAYYDVANFKKLISFMEFDLSTQYAVVDNEGETICYLNTKGTEQLIFNVWTDILGDAVNVSDISKVKEKFEHNQSCVVKVDYKGAASDKMLVFAPIGINDWKFVVTLDYSYVETMLQAEWEVNRAIIVQLIVCLLVFACLAVTFIVIARLRDKEKNKNLADKADTDMLTGLTNKSATERLIREYMEEHPGEQALLFVLDIDNFKKINDTMGHAFGDEVLRSLGHQIRIFFRVTDIIGRTGGDEFMIFLKGMKDDESILKEARKLEYFFKNFQTGEYVKYSATASIGTAVYPRDAANFEDLYKIADKALYKAKQRGKNQLAFYDEEPFKNISR